MMAVDWVDGGVRLSGAGLVVEAEDDGEAAAVADGVRAGEGDEVGDGEVELVEEVDEGDSVGSWAWHYVVRVLLACR